MSTCAVHSADQRVTHSPLTRCLVRFSWRNFGNTSTDPFLAFVLLPIIHYQLGYISDCKDISPNTLGALPMAQLLKSFHWLLLTSSFASAGYVSPGKSVYIGTSPTLRYLLDCGHLARKPPTISTYDIYTIEQVVMLLVFYSLTPDLSGCKGLAPPPGCPGFATDRARGRAGENVDQEGQVCQSSEDILSEKSAKFKSVCRSVLSSCTLRPPWALHWSVRALLPAQTKRPVQRAQEEWEDKEESFFWMWHRFVQRWSSSSLLLWINFSLLLCREKSSASLPSRWFCVFPVILVLV